MFLLSFHRTRQALHFNMDSFQTRLAEQVRLHKHLYDSSLKEHKDNQMGLNSWRDIAATLGKDEAFCRKMWKNMRDRFVKAKKRSHVKSSKLGRFRVVPPILTELAWLSEFTKHRESDSNFQFEDDGAGCTEVHRATLNFCALDNPMSSPDPHLPLSSLRLLVPPLRLMSACMWQVAQERNVDQYDKLAEFVMLATEMVPELLNYKQKTQLILGLRARLILEILKRIDEVDCEAIQDHLNSFQQITTKHMHEEDQDGDVEISKSAFVELVQTLLKDQSEKDYFFKEVFKVQYGARFDTALQILVWEFFSRLEELLPVPSFSQVFSMFDISSLDCEFEQFVSDPEDLKRILQHQQERQKLTRSEFTLMSDTILSTLASKQISVTSEHYIDQNISNKKSEEKTLEQGDIGEGDEETDDSSIETNPNSRLHEYGLSPLTYSPCYEEAGAAGDDGTAGEAAFQPPRCSVEGVKEQLDLSRNKEPSEESMSQSLAGGRANVSENSLVRRFKCTQCDKSYKYKKDLKIHFLTHHSKINHSKIKVPSVVCSHCEKRFSSQHVLRIHVRSHTGERPFACSYCDRRFMKKDVLKAHVRTHTGERPYACPLCDKKFTQSTTRTVHLRTHMKEKPYLCSTCGMSFCSSGSLLVHSRTHTGERPYQCEVCGKGFRTSEGLTVHRRYHTGERPYACSQCDKAFPGSSCLKKHMRTHTGEKPHQCLTCHKRFSEKSNLKIHLRVHKNL